jgi:predicted nucleic acid-binding Zn ribbon protein
MFCSTCAAPLAAGNSYCNRCGTNLNKDRTPDQEKSITGALLTAVVLLGVLGLGLVIGGSIALKLGAELQEPAVVLYMILSFAVVGTVEMLLMRQLSRVLNKARDPKQLEAPAQPLFQPALVAASDARVAQLRTGPDGITSVTENTTRTLGRSFRES